jgi:hypothetical protein
MARAFQIMQGGTPAIAAIAITGGNSVNSAVSAAGTTQGTATALGAAFNVITTAAAGSGVILPQGQPGDRIAVYNAGVGAMYVYPPTSAKINTLATNGGAILAPNTFCEYVQLTTTQFYANLSA